MSFDSEEENKAFAEKFDFPFALLCDTSRAMGLAYDACDSAHDPCPNRITYVIGADGTIEQAIETEDPGGQADALLASF